MFGIIFFKVILYGQVDFKHFNKKNNSSDLLPVIAKPEYYKNFENIYNHSIKNDKAIERARNYKRHKIYNPFKSKAGGSERLVFINFLVYFLIIRYS